MATLRCAPSQARAVETVELLLAVAAELLAEVGTDGFNTNRLAERAGVTVPTVYRYFPNKFAVVEELARRLAEAWSAWFDDELLADPNRDWRETWCGYIDGFMSGIAAAPAGLAIRASLHALPELREIEEKDTRRLVARLSRTLRRRDEDLDPRKVGAVAELLLTSAIAVFDQAFNGSPRKRSRRIEALKAMHVAYLATLLEPSGREEGA